jgi:SAM-dependent methyltransferase
MSGAGETAGEERVEVTPYSALAWIYNHVMDHIDYRTWAKHVDRIYRRFRRKRGRAVDFACGTGALVIELARLGWDAVGLDGSPEMIEAARRRPAPPKGSAHFQVADLREVADVPPADCGVCLYDSLNYLMEQEDLADFFRAARQTLPPGGLLVFDLSTQANSQEHFNGYTMEEQVPGGWYHRTTRYDPSERIQHNLFNIRLEGDPTVYREHHQQRIWAISTVLKVLAGEGWRHLATYHEHTLKPGSERSERVHIAVEPV